MAVSRRTRIILTILAVPFLLVFISVLALKFYFTSERLKALLLPRIQAAINREVAINDIGLSFFPTFGVKIDGLSVSSPKGRAFTDRPLAHLEGMLIEVKFFPLLQKRFEIQRIIVDKPSVFLEITERGLKNFSDAGENEQQARDKRSEVEGERSGFILSNLEMRNGRFEYLDRRENRAIRMDGVDLLLQLESAGKAQVLQAESDVTISKFSYGNAEQPLIRDVPMRLIQNATIQTEEKKLTIEKGELQIESLFLGLSGSIALGGEKPFVDLTFGSENIDLRQVISLLPQDLVKETGDVQFQGMARLSGTVKGGFGEGDEPIVTVAAGLANGKIHYSKLPKAITDINLKANFTNKGISSVLDITDFSAKLGDNPFKMKATIREFNDPIVDVNFDGEMNLSQLKDFYPLKAGITVSGIVKARISVAGRASMPSSAKGNGLLDLQRVAVVAESTQIQNLSGVVRLNNQQIESKQLKMDYGGSDLTLSFTMKNYLSVVLPSAVEKEKTRPPLPSVTFSASSSYFESTPSTGTLFLPPYDADGTLTVSKFIYRGKVPLECTDVRAHVAISENIVRVKSLSLDALGGKMSMAGTIDLQNRERPKFNLTGKVDGADGHSTLKRFTTFGDHLFGNVSLSLELNGEFDQLFELVHGSLSGEGNIQLVDGKLLGYPVLDRLATFLEVPEMKAITFRSWSNAFRIVNGKINIPDLKISATENDLLLSGWHGFDGSLDYSLTIKLSDSLTNRFLRGDVARQVSDLFKDKDGRVTIFLLLGGPTDSPKLRWDTQKAQQKLREKVEEEIRKKKEEIRDKATDELKKKLEEGKSKVEDRLKKIFKKP